MKALWDMPTNTRDQEVDFLTACRLAAQSAKSERAEDVRQKYRETEREVWQREVLAGRSSVYRLEPK